MSSYEIIVPAFQPVRKRAKNLTMDGQREQYLVKVYSLVNDAKQGFLSLVLEADTLYYAEEPFLFNARLLRVLNELGHQLDICFAGERSERLNAYIAESLGMICQKFTFSDPLPLPAESSEIVKALMAKEALRDKRERGNKNINAYYHPNRAKLNERLAELHDQYNSAQDIASILNEEGHRTAQGNEIRANRITHFIEQLKDRNSAFDISSDDFKVLTKKRKPTYLDKESVLSSDPQSINTREDVKPVFDLEALKKKFKKASWSTTIDDVSFEDGGFAHLDISTIFQISSLPATVNAFLLSVYDNKNKELDWKIVRRPVPGFIPAEESSKPSSSSWSISLNMINDFKLLPGTYSFVFSILSPMEDETGRCIEVSPDMMNYEFTTVVRRLEVDLGAKLI